MAHTDHSDRTPRRTPHGTLRTARRGLRREVPSTVGLLADERDFTAMRCYRTFTFDDHAAYLRGIDGLLKSLASQGVHTTVALFDPEEYAEYCAESGLDPDTADSRGRFTARIPGSGAAIAYTGQPIDSLVPQLISTAVRRATWEYATTLLADLGECADCGQDIGRAAFDRASHLLLRLLEGAGSGTHHLVCSVPAVDERLLAVLRTECPDSSPDGPGGVPARLDSSQAAEFVTVLAVGIALESAGGVVLRTTRADDPDRLHGWRLQRGSLVPLTAGEVFSAYCTDADTGEPVSPEFGVEYCPGFDLGPDDTGTHH
ncbi:hypothetical protein [Streptomyces sp. 35G-GA-8]|uniref:hypothetical protein n=1 Tax=Streptomyces sp. 35G-GA-8 TaxID=2939434 RepID=UPI00201EEED0|nr:hypothetical protein [Streptomyces sp. 35G-GA-8]MCL7378963.1 hypothetical protein [Streptomyces sp. 35G-GA-8]